MLLSSERGTEMGKARKISLTTRSFDTPREATSFFAAMLNRYKIGERVSAEDAAHLSALLERHDELETKVGSGIAGFEVDNPPANRPQLSKRCFWMVRSDGTKINFSFVRCLQPKSSD